MVDAEVLGQESWRVEWLARNVKYSESHYLRYIRNRNKRNRNTQILTVGSQGSGKTFHNIACCLLLDPTFSIEQITFSPEQLLRLVNDGKLKAGSCVILEEAGIQAPSASWQSKEVKLFTQFFETARRLKINFFLNCPSRDNIAKSIRNLMHIECSPRTIDLRKRVVKCRAYLLQPNPLRGKVYTHKLQRKSEDGNIPVRGWSAPEPPAEFLEQYHKKRDAFQRELNKELLSEFESLGAAGKEGKKLARCDNCKRIFRSEFFSIDAPPRKCSSCSSKNTRWYELLPEDKGGIDSKKSIGE